MSDLAKKTLEGFAQLMIVLAILLFAVAWSIRYWQAWLYLGVFSVSVALITWYLWKKDPKLLERRVNAGPVAEKEKKQKIIQLFASLSFIAIFVVSSLDHRFSWSNVSSVTNIVGDILVFAGFLIVFLVFKENTFTAATIEIASNQKVISTGPYSIIRHPMYAGAFIMLIGTPLALGSLWGLLGFIFIAITIIFRLFDEEKFLLKKLKGYKKYCAKVPYRIIPFIW